MAAAFRKILKKKYSRVLTRQLTDSKNFCAYDWPVQRGNHGAPRAPRYPKAKGDREQNPEAYKKFKQAIAPLVGKKMRRNLDQNSLFHALALEILQTI